MPLDATTTDWPAIVAELKATIERAKTEAGDARAARTSFALAAARGDKEAIAARDAAAALDAKLALEIETAELALTEAEEHAAEFERARLAERREELQRKVKALQIRRTAIARDVDQALAVAADAVAAYQALGEDLAGVYSELNPNAFSSGDPRRLIQVGEAIPPRLVEAVRRHGSSTIAHRTLHAFEAGLNGISGEAK